MSNTHHPDFGIGDACQELLTRSEDIVSYLIRLAVDVDGDDLAPVLRLKLRSERALIDRLTASCGLLWAVRGWRHQCSAF